MALFGQKRDGSAAPEGAGRESLLKARWFRGLMSFCMVLVILGVCYEVYRRAAKLGTSVVEAQPVDASIKIVNPPKWLHREIVEKLLQEAYTFAGRDDETYHRARNILDNDVLREIANLYTGVDVVEGKKVSRQSRGYNAWIRRVSAVRRIVSKDRTTQEIQITAEWREAAAWVKVGETYYLMDEDGTRLPGDYSGADRSRTKMMVVTGVDLPVIDGVSRVALPGEKWTGKDGAVGADWAAGMELVKALEGQAYASQVDAIDMTNFNGRRDAMAPWILLNTIWQTASGAPRVIQWGRPMGAEKFYEVQASAKIKVLNELFLRFNRIDAGRDYVDIRTEFPRLPKLASQADQPVPSLRG